MSDPISDLSESTTEESTPESVPTETAPKTLREFTLFNELVGIMQSQERSVDDIERVRQGFELARHKHEGQYRKNKENYIVHPVSVAIILANIPVDTNTIIAALLHDVLEDCDCNAEEIEKPFGEDVLKIVQGVTKLGKFQFASKEDRQAENFRKMFLAMADDIRVIMLKLADRLHNMQTLDFMKEEKQTRIAAETLEIFAPLANRMGMGKLRAELEDLSLKYLDTEKYTAISNEIEDTRDEREGTITTVIDKINDQLAKADVNASIYGRVKNLYSIYKKMQTRQKNVEEIYDLSAVRIIVNNEKECYEVLGIIHSAFTPIPGRFKDYIAMPKSNLYQSLHTTVIGPKGLPLEVQIRTEDMHRIAEYGIAAHWKYKEKGGSNFVDLSDEEQKLSWLKQMVEMKEEADDAKEYVDSVKLDLFTDEVFVFTPRGRVVVLPRKSTPVDFAYRIHTEVGNTCSGAIINGKIETLDYELKNGDIAEIITNKKASPRLDWINFVQTQQAKSRIRQWFKKHLRDEHEQQGRRSLEEELTKAVFDKHLKEGKFQEIASELNYSNVQDLFSALGFGEISLPKVINRIKRDEILKENPASEYNLKRFVKQDQTPEKPKKDIQGLEGMLYQLAKCCTPLPGEDIIGVVTRSRGVMVHRFDCQNLNSANPGRMMEIDWGKDTQAKTSNYSVKLEIHVIDRVGVLKDVLGQIADLHTNISDTKVKLLDDHTATITITLSVKNLKHLDTVKKGIMKVNDVLTVKRVEAKRGSGGSSKDSDQD